MNNKFMLFDRISNVGKEANYIVTVNYQNYNYVLYYIDSNQNKEVFASKIIVNSEGKKFISDITKEEKSRLSTIAYNVVIATPTEAKNNVNKEELKNNLENKLSIKLVYEVPTFQNQDYFSNSRLAITSDELIKSAISFYKEVLKVVENVVLPEQSTPIEVNSSETINIVPKNNNLVVNETIPSVQEEVVNIPNPQMQILSATEEPQNNVPIFINPSDKMEEDKKNNEGFVINTSIVVGTIAILLAVIIVTVTFISIKKMIM